MSMQRHDDNLLLELDAEEAYIIIDFLNRLNDELWALHGKRITEKRWQEMESNERQLCIDFDDDIPI